MEASDPQTLKILDSPVKLELDTTTFRRFLNGHRRLRGGMSTQEYEEMHGSVTKNKQPSFAEEGRNHFRSIGWGVNNPKLINFSAIKEKFNQSLSRKISLQK